MSPDEQFWWNWSVQLATAVFTLLAVFMALFGNWLRSMLARPTLRISLNDPRGERTDVTIQRPDQPPEVTEARWYHVRVENKRRWSSATQVQVFLLRLEEPNASGTNTATWAGEVPMKWRHMPMNPAAARTVGYPQDCDLVSVFKSGFLQLQPLLAPSPLDRLIARAEKCKMCLILQARALEADSNILKIEIAWDGNWHDETEQMGRHMVVREISTI